MLYQPKGPSRFIPTLTDVVVEEGSGDTSGIPASAILGAREQPEAPLEAGLRTVTLQAAPVLSREAQARAQHPVSAGFEEYLVHRVMQRVDVGLDQRLRDAIATVLSEQTRSLLPRLREEVESVVRYVVCEAVADELAADGKAENIKS